MEWINILVTLVVGIAGGSIGGAIINRFLDNRATRFNANYERKLNRYTHIITMIELYLHTENVMFSINTSMWDVREVSVEENQKRTWNDLLVNGRQLEFIADNPMLLDAYKRFLQKPNDTSYEKLLLEMKHDLWKTT